jgi:hypothetical protein
MHQAVVELPQAVVVANSDMGFDNGRINGGLPEGAMHSQRKVGSEGVFSTIVSALQPWSCNLSRVPW